MSIMKYYLKVGIVVLVAASIVLPSAYYVYISMRQPGPLPSSFVPEGAVSVFRVQAGNESILGFYINNSFGFILEGKMQAVQSDVSSLFNGNTTNYHGEITIRQYEKYGGSEIYSIYNLSSSLDATLNTVFSPVNLSVSTLDINTSALYISEEDPGIVVIGNLYAVQASISAGRNGHGMNAAELNMLNKTAVFSLYYDGMNPILTSALINSYPSATHVKIYFVNGSIASLASAAVMKYMANVTSGVSVNGDLFSATFDFGTSNYARYAYLVTEVEKAVFKPAG